MRTIALLLASLAFTAAPSFAMHDNPPAKAADKAATLHVGDPAPPLTIDQWIKGAPVTSFEKGKIYVVEFWATWCGPCINSMPHLTQLQAEYKDKGVTIIGVSKKDARGNTLEKAQQMVERKGDGVMGYTIAWDRDNATSAAFMDAAKQPGIPTAFVVNKDGTLAYIGHPMFLDMVLEKIVAGSWSPEAGSKQIEAVEKEVNGVFESNDPKKILESFNAVEAKYPKIMSTMQDTKYEIMVAANDPGAPAMRSAIFEKALAAKNEAVLNALAWAVVDPRNKDAGKDLDFAFHAANEAANITQNNDPMILDTLARVYWLQGDKAKAIDVEDKAVGKLPDGKLKTELTKTLEEYKTTDAPAKIAAEPTK